MPTQGIDFAQLSLRDALDLAILIEYEARERYEELAEQMDLHDTPEAANFFRWMAKNETRHGDQLQSRRRQLFGREPRRVSSTMLWNVEAPGYEQAQAFMSPRQAMEVALSCERKAHAFFVAALPKIENSEVRSLFEELRDEEVEHQELVEQEIACLPEEPDVDPEAFVDDPVAQ